MPQKLEKQVIWFRIEKYQETLKPRFNKAFIPDSIKLTLNSKSFQLDSKSLIKSLIQTLETVVGNKMAPTYVNITLSYLEKDLYKIIRKNKSINLANVVEGDAKAPFSIDTIARRRGGWYSILWIAPLYIWSLHKNCLMWVNMLQDLWSNKQISSPSRLGL